MTSIVNRLSDDFESARMLLPSASAVASLLSNTADHTTTATTLYNSTPWSQRRDCANRLLHIQAHPTSTRPAAPQLDYLLGSLVAGSMQPSAVSLPQWALLCKSPKGAAAAKRLCSEHSLWVDAFARFLTAAAAQLKVLLLQHACTSLAATGPCLQLWRLVTHHCCILLLPIGPTWPLSHLISNTPLLTAFSSLMDTLRYIQHSDPPRQLWLLFSESEEAWEEDVLVVLHAPGQCFKRFSKNTSHGAGAAGTMAALPRDLTSGMCSVSCHQLRLDLARELHLDTAPTRGGTAVGVVLSLFTSLVHCIRVVQPIAERKRLSTLLISSSVREAAKLALLTCVRYPPDLWLEHMCCPSEPIMILAEGTDCSSTTTSGSSGSSIINSSRGGTNGSGPASGYNILGSDSADPAGNLTTSDEALLFAMRLCSFLHPGSALVIHSYMLQDVKAWHGSPTGPPTQRHLLPSNPAPLESAVQYMGRVYHHTTLHTLVWMKHHQKAARASLHVQACKDAVCAAESNLKIACRLHECDLATQHGIAAVLEKKAVVDEALMNLRLSEGRLEQTERRASCLPWAFQGLQRLLLCAMVEVRNTYPSSILSGM